jgi:cell division protein FtsI (penicillin-binding protein 3)
VGEHATYSALGEQQRIRHIPLPATRGQILDRTGEPLALSLRAQDVYADLDYVNDPAATASQLAPILGVRAQELDRSLTNSNSSFVYLARQVEPKTAAKVEALGSPGIGLLPTSKRYYPAGDLAPQVLGLAFGSLADLEMPRSSSWPTR